MSMEGAGVAGHVRTLSGRDTNGGGREGELTGVKGNRLMNNLGINKF